MLVALMAGCSNYSSFRGAQVAEAEGDWDEAVLKYMELVASDPADLRYRAGLQCSKIQASHYHFEQGKKLREAGLLEQALLEMQRAVQLDPTNQYAAVEMEKVRTAIETDGGQVETIAELKEKARGSVGQPPTLNPRSDEPIDLDFPEQVSIMQIYQALGKAFGINILFDPKLRDQTISIQLKDVTAQDALEILMRTAGHFYKVLDEHSILVIADTPQNRRTYEDLIIQTFFLSNSDVKEVMTMLRSLVDARKIASNESLNAIVLRDTADKVKIAERIISQNDKARAEVVVDVELLQINTSKLQDLGVSLDAYQAGVSLDTGGDEVPLRLSDVEFLNQNNWVLTIPNFLFDFVKNSTDAQALAKPQLRISEGERARLVIGDRVPIPVTSFNTSNTVGSNIVPITSFQYQEVGIRIEIEPRVHHNNEISLSLTVEVSDISGNVGDQPIIGTRNIETTIRLRDGETNFLAGLIRTNETNSEEGIPGLADIPVLGRLFSKKRSENQRTDIALTLTPHIIRRADITEEDLTPIWVGTEQNITFRGASPRVESNVEGPFDEGDDSENPQDAIRRRLQERLPPGLRDDANQEEPAENQGVELVPNNPPPGRVDLAPESSPLEELELLPESTEPAEAELAQAVGAGDPSNVQPELTAVLAAFETPGVELRMVPRGLQVATGDAFEVRLEVDVESPVAHLPFHVEFDPERLELVEFVAGDFLGASDEATFLTDRSEEGRLIVGASRLGKRPGVAGSGVLGTLKLKAIQSGPAQLLIQNFRPSSPTLEELGADIEAAGAVEINVLPVVERPEIERKA